eukprot:gene11776-5114_t
MKEAEIKKFVHKEVVKEMTSIKYKFWIQGIILGILLSISFNFFYEIQIRKKKSGPVANYFSNMNNQEPIDIEIKILVENSKENINDKEILKQSIFSILNDENQFILKENSMNILYIVNSKGSNRFFENFPKKILKEVENKKKVLISLLINSFQCDEENDIKQYRLKEFFKKNKFYNYETDPESLIIHSYLRLAKINYEHVEGTNYPTLFLDDNKISNFNEIFQHLKLNYKFQKDEKLNEKEKLKFESFTILLLEEFLPCLNYHFYNDSKNFSDLKKIIQKQTSIFDGLFLPYFIRKKKKTKCEINPFEKAKFIIKSCSNLLKESENSFFIFGE